MATAITRTPSEVARAAFAAVIGKDPEGIVALGAPGYVDDFVAIGQMRGQDAIRAFFSELFAAFPDFEITVDRAVTAVFNVKTKLGQRYRGAERRRQAQAH